ncbi:hypothetical protein ABH924_001175 [Arthrobacter sp. GAS37]
MGRRQQFQTPPRATAKGRCSFWAAMPPWLSVPFSPCLPLLSPGIGRLAVSQALSRFKEGHDGASAVECRGAPWLPVPFSPCLPLLSPGMMRLAVSQALSEFKEGEDGTSPRRRPACNARAAVGIRSSWGVRRRDLLFLTLFAAAEPRNGATRRVVSAFRIQRRGRRYKPPSTAGPFSSPYPAGAGLKPWFPRRGRTRHRAGRNGVPQCRGLSPGQARSRGWPQWRHLRRGRIG